MPDTIDDTCFAECKECRIILERKSLRIVDGSFGMSDRKVRDQARMRVAFSSNEDTMERDILAKGDAMVASDSESTRIYPFCQVEASKC